jgi:hypothetical protein
LALGQFTQGLLVVSNPALEALDIMDFCHKLEEKIHISFPVLFLRFQKLPDDGREQEVNSLIFFLLFDQVATEDLLRVEIDDQVEYGYIGIEQIE